MENNAIPLKQVNWIELNWIEKTFISDNKKIYIM